MSDPSSSVTWLGVGFGIAWLALGAYVVRLWRAQRELQNRFDELDDRKR